jgi:uncharacterized membrane protein
MFHQTVEGRLSMKLAGHAIHPMLIVFPLGLLATAVAFDLAGLGSGSAQWHDMAYWMIAAGLIGGLGAAIFGLIDYVGIPRETRARSVGLWHGVINVLVLALFAASWFLRGGNPVSPPPLSLALSFAGAGFGLIAGWLGGELVQRLGIGVDTGANPNAPSSLSGRPASSIPTPRRAA